MAPSSNQSHLISVIITQLPCGLCALQSPLPLQQNDFFFLVNSLPVTIPGLPLPAGQGPHPQPGTRDPSCLASGAHLPIHLFTYQVPATLDILPFPKQSTQSHDVDLCPYGSFHLAFLLS